MTVSIREFNKTDADLEALVPLDNRIWDHRRSTLEEWQHALASAPKEGLWRQWMAERDGCVVGSASQERVVNNARPSSFSIKVLVDPVARGSGVGRQLCEYCVTQLRKEHDQVSCLFCATRENQPTAISFLETRGFRLVLGEVLSQIEVDSFDSLPFPAKVEQCKVNGIEIQSLKALQGQFPDWKKRVYSLENELEIDVPTADPLVPLPFDDYCKHKFAGPEFSIDTKWIALQAVEWLGITESWLSKGDPSKAHTRMTGVRRKARRRGVATTLKLQALAFARSQGIKIMQTDNEENNPMFQFNLALGIKPVPALIHYRYDFLKHS